MPPGPALGALLGDIREKQLADELRTPAEALAYARQRLAAGRPPGPSAPAAGAGP
jgi:hypothetical protein